MYIAYTSPTHGIIKSQQKYYILVFIDSKRVHSYAYLGKKTRTQSKTQRNYAQARWSKQEKSTCIRLCLKLLLCSVS